jgi:hypothetical protein
MKDQKDRSAVFEEKEAADKGNQEAWDQETFVEGEERSYGGKKSQAISS